MKSKFHNAINNLILFSLLFLNIAPFQAISTANAPKLYSTIAQLAANSPNQMVSVIVQKNEPSDAAEKLAIRLGGRIIQDLHIINAFAVEIPAAALIELSASSAVRWISPDEAVQESTCTNCSSIAKLATDYAATVHADQVWNQSPSLQGQGITVAVVDSGIRDNHPDLSGRIVAQMNVSRTLSANDFYGHGTYVAGIIAGNGGQSDGSFRGIAPQANLVNVKVSNYFGSARESDVIAGLQWIYENRTAYNIRVVNLSINSATAQSYHTSPLAAACEILWFNGVVVVVSSGNSGAGTVYPPANDPFVITVGATDSSGTADIRDDTVATFSAYGVTSDGFNKPDLVAPGRHLVSTFAGAITNFSSAHPNNVVNDTYFIMSGTSVAAPIVSGAVALLLQNEPNLTPDQVKYRLKATANKAWKRYDSAKANAGILDVQAAVASDTTASENMGVPVSHLLTTGSEGVLSSSVSWNSMTWDSVSWNSVSWNSVSWNSVSWNSVSWNSTYWEDDGTTTTISSTSKTAKSLSSDFADGNKLDRVKKEEANSVQLFLPLVTR